MQGQRKGTESLPDALELDSAPGSSVEQDAFWNNMLVDPIETRNMSSYVRPSNSNMYVDVPSQEGLNLNLWNAGGNSSSAQSNSHSGHDEIKMGHGWSSSATISVGGNRKEEGRCEAANMLSLGNMNLNINTTDVPQSSVHNNSGKARVSDQVLETGLSTPCDSVLFQPEDVPSSSGSSSIFESSSGNAGIFLEETDRRSVGSLNGGRLSCKRKNVEGFPGQSSSSGTAPFFRRGETNISHTPASNIYLSHSSGYRLGLSSPIEQHNTGACSVSRDVNSDCLLSVNASGSAESSHRNFRTRINPTRHRGMTSPSIWAPGSSSGQANVWGSPQQYSPIVPFNHSVDTMPFIASTISYPQPPMPVMPNIPENVQYLPWNGSSSRLSLGSSSSSSIPAGENSSVSGGVMLNNISERSLHVPAVEVRPPVNRRAPNLASDRMILGGNSDTPRQGPSSSSSEFYPSLGTALVSQQNVLSCHHQRVSDVARASIFPTSGSEFDGQSRDFPLHRPRRSSSPEIGSLAVRHGNQQQNALRSGAAVDRLNGGTLVPPLSIRTLAGRRRILSEHIRNALSVMRRGDNLHFEDVILFDHAVFHGTADLHDRHRDMRLDVDNMSYEELLALEERIGNVSTGLNEEKIMKSLKQHKYSSSTSEACQEVEPCCICQEDYAEGEELGQLDCGHDFHTVCIKQWLMQKNLCPICKYTALHP